MDFNKILLYFQSSYLAYFYVFNSYGFSFNQLKGTAFTYFVRGAPNITALDNNVTYNEEQQL